MTEEYEGLTLTEYDAREQAEKHREAEFVRVEAERAAKRRHELAVKRWQTGGAVLGGLTAAAAAVALAYILWVSQRGPSTEDQQRQEARLACIEKGGVWIGTTGSDDSRGNATDGFGTCAFGLGE